MQNTDCQLFGDSVEEELLLNGKGSTQEQRDDLLKLYGLFEWKDKHPATPVWRSETTAYSCRIRLDRYACFAFWTNLPAALISKI